MKKQIALIALAVMLSGIVYASILNPLESAPANYASSTLNASYDELGNAFFPYNGSKVMNNTYLVIPWFKSDNSVAQSNLQNGSNCNIGTVTYNSNCMVTDEFSQAGIIVSMGNNQTRMEQYFNSVKVMLSDYGVIPGWRCVNNFTNNTISCTDSRVNSNHDTAHDATARIIISLYAASTNQLFTNETQKTAYKNYANTLIAQSLQYEIVKQWYNGTQGSNIYYFMAGGSSAASSGLGATDFSFSGYFPDSIISFLSAAVMTGNNTYCAVAGNITLQYLQSAAFNGTAFTVPPGKSFKYINITGGNTTPVASCTNTCSPDQFDGADAVRMAALGMAEYYDTVSGKNCLPARLTTYLDLYKARYLTPNLNSVPLQFYSNGTPSASNQSGYFAQGLQAEGVIYDSNKTPINTTMRNALAHYSDATKTWDSSAGFGIYGQSISWRVLGVVIGRDAGLWSYNATTPNATDTYNITTYGASVNKTILNTSDDVRINISANTTQGDINNITVQVTYPAGTLYNYSMTRITTITNGTNYTNTTTHPNGTYYILSSCNFTSTSDTCGATGGTLNTTDNTYNDLANFQTWTFGSFNLTSYSYFNFTANYYWTNASNDKIFIEENTTSTSTTPHVIVDMASNLLRMREEPGYSKTSTGTNKTWVKWQIVVNRTASVMYFYNGSTVWNATISFLNNASADYVRIALGGQKGFVKITNITLTVLAGEVNVTTTTNSTINVTTNTSDWYYDFLNVTTNGTYNVTRFYVFSTTGEYNLTMSNLNFTLPFGEVIVPNGSSNTTNTTTSNSIIGTDTFEGLGNAGTAISDFFDGLAKGLFIFLFLIGIAGGIIYFVTFIKEYLPK